MALVAVKDTEFVPPAPRPGAIFAIYKKPGDRHLWCNIVLPDGHKEQWDTEKTQAQRFIALAVSRRYVLALCRQRGVPTPADERRSKGELSPYKRTKANKLAIAAGKTPPYPVGKRGYGLEYDAAATPKSKLNGATKKFRASMDEGQNGGDVVALVKYQSSDQKWVNFLDAHAKRCILFFDTISRMFILGMAVDDPVGFVEHCKALILETMGTTGYKKKGRPPL